MILANLLKQLKKIYFPLLILCIFSCTINVNKVTEPIFIGYLGTSLTTKMEGNSWTIGCEVLDRDYTNYFSYNTYLPILGAKTARLQLGWAKCEKQKGIYDFKWLDEIITDLSDKGIRPWLQFSYGNPIYEGGGEPTLAGGMPYSEEALIAWDKWVKEIVIRFGHYTNYWEVWNEPNLPNKHDSIKNPEAYGKFFIRTTEIIKQQQPDAIVSGLVICGMHISTFEYIKNVLDYLRKMGKLNLLNEITYHPYPEIPEETYSLADSLRLLLLKYDPKISIKHGETGCPSGTQVNGPLSKLEWTETSQSKWLLRRMAGDYANNIPTSIFSIIDYSYPITTSLYNEGYTIKMGLLGNDSLKHVKTKASFYAVRNAINIMDYKWQMADEKNFTVETPYDNIKPDNIYCFRLIRRESSKNMMIVWLGNEIPDDLTQKIWANLIVHHVQFEEPVIIDLMDGKVFSIPKRNLKINIDSTFLMNIPIYDSPVIITEKSEIQILQKKNNYLPY